MKKHKYMILIMIASLFLSGCSMLTFPEGGYNFAPLAVNPERMMEDDTQATEEVEGFTIGNWDVLYGEWMDLEQNRYVFNEGGTYCLTLYEENAVQEGTYTVESKEDKDYLVMRTKEGSEVRYELGFVRAGVALYSTEEGKETELAAYLLAMM